MNEPAPATPPPGIVPPPPPQLKVKRLWLSILAPPAVTAIAMTFLAIFVNEGRAADIIFPIGCIAVCLSTLAGWVVFILVIRERFAGTSFVLLCLAYPLTQSILIFAIFFVGCLVAVSRSGFH